MPRSRQPVLTTDLLHRNGRTLSSALATTTAIRTDDEALYA